MRDAVGQTGVVAVLTCEVDGLGMCFGGTIDRTC